MQRAVADPAIIEAAWEMDAKGFANPGMNIIDGFAQRTRESLEALGLPADSAEAVFLVILSDAAKAAREEVEAEALRVAQG